MPKLLAWYVCATLAAAFVMSLAGCAHTKQPKTKTEVTAVGGFTKVEQGANRVSEAADHLKNSALADVQLAYVGEVIDGLKEIREGEAESQRACNEAIKQADSSRQPYYARIDWISIGAGVVLSLGLAVIVMSFFSPVGGKLLGVGAGLACLGGAGMVVFLAMRGVAQSLSWAIPCVAGIGVLALAYFVWERISARRDRLKREQALAEVVATGEAVVARPDVPNQAIAEEAAKIQSPATTEIVREVKATSLIAKAVGVAAQKAAEEAGTPSGT